MDYGYSKYHRQLSPKSGSFGNRLEPGFLFRESETLYSLVSGKVLMSWFGYPERFLHQLPLSALGSCYYFSI